MVGTFIARYKGRCAGCGQWFGEGRPCAYNEAGEIVTQDCEGSTDVDVPGPADIAKIRKNMCAKCFCIHAGECA